MEHLPPDTTNGTSTPLQSGKRARPTLQVDIERYAPYLEDADITDEQKRELIEALWSIMISFVDLGFGIEPVQQVVSEILDAPVRDEPPVVKSKDKGHKDEFIEACGRAAEREST